MCCAVIAWCADSVFYEFLDYYTLRVGGLIFAGVIVFLSIILLAGKSPTSYSVSVKS